MRSLDFLFAPFIPEVEAKKPAIGKTNDHRLKKPPKKAALSHQRRERRIQQDKKTCRQQLFYFSQTPQKNAVPYPDLCQQKKLNFHTYMSVDNMGSLNFHPSPRLVKSPSLSPLGQCQRRTSEESRLLPSRSNEATPNPTVSGEAIRSTGTSHRSKSLRILAPGHNPM